MCMYEQMIIDNLGKFKGDEKVMKQSVRLVNNLLEKMKEHHPEMYWEFMRDHHEIMYGKHFNRDYAEWEVAQMHHKCGDKVYKGEHWSHEQTTDVMSSYKTTLPAEITPCDFFVALNSQWHDYHCLYMSLFPSEEEAEKAIIESAIKFWFKDDDWDGNTKVWCYFRMKNK